LSRMLRVDDSVFFQRVTVGHRKPAVRFHLASGRPVELIGFHLEPAYLISASDAFPTHTGSQLPSEPSEKH
jgi:hypothetical protein